jgi:RNA polymerase sigma factor (sigma-70 family)
MGTMTQDEFSGNLLARWRQGDEQAAAELFHRYASRLVGLARSRLSAKLSARLDAEDVVQSAYRSFFAGAREGRYDLQRGGDLWHLLVGITLHKLYGQARRNSSGKRSIQREASGEGLLGVHAPLLARQPSPLEALALADQLEAIMRLLLPLHRRMLELRLQGYNVDEIAAATDSGERTVRRVLDRVKQQLANWQDDGGSPRS